LVKIGVVFGTRPEAIKMAPVVQKLKESQIWETKIIVTGQHREMLDQVLRIFQIVPDYDLNIMAAGQSLTDITVAILSGLSNIFQGWLPDYLFVHGDTTTTFAATLAGFYHKIPVAHVEAGLRTNSLTNPYPEEANRRLTDLLAELYFAPTEQAAANLRKEGIEENRIFVTGNTVIDALFSVVKADYQFKLPELRQLSFSKPIILATAHRRENWGKPLEEICQGLQKIAETYPVEIVFAMHKNPLVQQVVRKYLQNIDNVHLIDAPDYVEFANLLSRCHFLVTDSGGLQEEAAALGKPVLVLRETTERPEGIEAGIIKLIGTRKERIVKEISNLLIDQQLYDKMASAKNPFGDGTAALKIKQILEEYIKVRGVRDDD